MQKVAFSTGGPDSQCSNCTGRVLSFAGLWGGYEGTVRGYGGTMGGYEGLRGCEGQCEATKGLCRGCEGAVRGSVRLWGAMRGYGGAVKGQWGAVKGTRCRPGSVELRRWRMPRWAQWGALGQRDHVLPAPAARLGDVLTGYTRRGGTWTIVAKSPRGEAGAESRGPPGPAWPGGASPGDGPRTGPTAGTRTASPQRDRLWICGSVCLWAGLSSSKVWWNVQEMYRISSPSSKSPESMSSK